MDFKKLEYLESVYRLRNFTKAAEEQYISQPSISSAIQSLEEELDVTLINRGTRPLSFTPAGEFFMEYVKRILKEVKDAEDAMKHLSKQAQETINIAIYSSSTSQIIPKIYMDFQNNFPQYTLTISENTLTVMLEKILSGELDMAYALLPDDYDQDAFKMIPIEYCELYVLLSVDHPLAQESVLSLSQLQNERVFSYAKGALIRKKLDEELEKQHISLNQLVPPRIDLTNPIVEQNQGVSFILNDKFHNIPISSKLTIRPLSPPISFQAGLIFKQGVKFTNAMKDMKQYLIDIHT